MAAVFGALFFLTEQDAALYIPAMQIVSRE